MIFDHSVSLPNTGAVNTLEMLSWCEEQFGSEWAVDNSHGRWTRIFRVGRTHIGEYRWSFQSEQDLILFTLRWA